MRVGDKGSIINLGILGCHLLAEDWHAKHLSGDVNGIDTCVKKGKEARLGTERSEEVMEPQ